MKKLIIMIAIFAIYASTTAQINILSNGNVGIGANCTNPTYELETIGAVKFTKPNWGYDPIYFEWATSTGSPRIYSPSLLALGLENYPVHVLWTTWLYSKNSYNWSDERLKENIKPLGSTLNRLMEIEGKRFTYKKDTESVGKMVLKRC